MNCILAFAAAATHRYHNAPADDALLTKHRCTFSYTSNASGSPQSLVEDIRRAYTADATLLAAFDRAAREIFAKASTGYVWDTARVAELLDDCAGATLAATARRELIAHLRLLSDRAFRHAALRWVVAYCKAHGKTLRLYGGGWESNPEFAAHAAGFLAPGEEMRAVYQASEINLQIIETGFLHSRVLDGLAAGGFFLYRLAHEARDLDQTENARLIMARRAIETGCVTYAQLDASIDPLIIKPWAHARSVIRPGKPEERCRMLDIWLATPSEEIQIPQLDRITFSNQQQFNEMADRYLANAQLRGAVANEFRQVIVDRFSYDARWKQFLSGIAAGLQSAAGAERKQPRVPQAA